MKVRFDERLSERTRLARELHDTLLQTIQGSKLVADGIEEYLDDPPRAKQSLAKLSQWLSQAMDEGRAALESLRNAASSEELSEALRIPQMIALPTHAGISDSYRQCLPPPSRRQR